MTRPLLPSLFVAYDYITDRVLGRLDGLTRAEYLWEPVPDGWSVREVDGEWIADWARPDPIPAPVTTIAWRMWHIADCLAGYVDKFDGGWPLHVRSVNDGKPGWFADPGPALAELQLAVAVFRERITALGEDGIHRALGPDWGPFAESSWGDLVIHAIDEVSHHGAEIALLRDIYPALAP
jgi:hypothetical protein